MKNFINTIKGIWQIEELRQKIGLTLLLLIVFRFGASVVLPGIDATAIPDGGFLSDQNKAGILGLLAAFTGGGFSKASVFALGIMPYISASIVVQLMQVAIPYLQKLQKDGESGRRKITQITRWLTILICLLQAPAYIGSLNQLGIPPEAYINGAGTQFWVSSMVVLITGCIFAMWLGEKITDKGIGNGISILIMVGIIATLPQSFAQEISSRVAGESTDLMMVLIEVVVWLLIIFASVMLVMAVRKIPVQYARRTATGGFDEAQFGKRDYIPLKLNSSGVMPIIFAQAIMFVPALIGNKFDDSAFGQFLALEFSQNAFFGLWYNVVFAVLIIGFTYLYTAMMPQNNPTKMADDLKRSNGFIPGIKPGSETADYLDRIMSLVTLPGSIFLAIIAIFPAIAYHVMNINQGWALFYGGTSLLIMVGVAIDTMQQVNAYLLNKHYDSLMKTGKNRKRAVA
ncbi:MAG: preprotein translocase subunit SecY [Flavobacteriaceae bacterium]|nr:preprotein translocase subunit SecY [Flavobacteriaceae bacterium]